MDLYINCVSVKVFFCANFYRLAEINLRELFAVDMETGKISWPDV